MNSSRLEVLFSPAEFAALAGRDLSGTTCVVFDILRATTSIVTALDRGAAAVIPVETIEEALELKRRDPNLLLAGERHGLRITAEQTGSIDFDFGNSPREFTAEKVAGRTIAMTTTNGTRALKACAGARTILAASFLNLGDVARRLSGVNRLLLVCSGTYEEASYEDTLAAGALADALWAQFPVEDISDSAQLARTVFLAAQNDLLGAMTHARNGRRLLSMATLAEDVPFCLVRDSTELVVGLVDGRVVKLV
jgi:2-phosphosulfolactate phosphatase